MTLDAQDDKGLAIFWDYETTGLNPTVVSGHEVVRTIRSALHKFGPITSFRAYHSSNQPLSGLNSELGSSGVTLVDCPSNGRKEAATIRMIIDIIAHAWDHPCPRTIVLITSDTDLAYLIAILRMRNFDVILMSPNGTHRYLRNQASVNLDWTTETDGRRTDVNDSYRGLPSPHLPPSPHPPPSPHRPPAPSFPLPPPATSGLFPHHPKTDFLSKAQEDIDPPMVELRGMPHTRSRRLSTFPHSYEPNGFNIFGDFGDSFASSNGMFGLGDRPLFARSQSQAPTRQVRSDSAPPGIVYSTHSPTSPPDSNGFWGIPSSTTKGKQREFPITEPQSPLSVKMPEVIQSTSANEMAEGFFTNLHPSSEKSNAQLNTGTSSVTSQSSIFSVIQAPLSTAPTSANKNDTMARAKSPATILVMAPQEPTVAQVKGPALRDTEKTSSPSPGKEETGKVISTKDSPRFGVDLATQPKVTNPSRASPTLPSSSQKAPQPTAKTTNAQAGPSTHLAPSLPYVAPKFQVLVNILREHKGSCTKSTLPSLLLKRDPNIYKTAGVAKYKTFLAVAQEAGLVQEVATTNSVYISLTAKYAV